MIANGKRVQMPNPNVSAFPIDICLESPGPRRLIGSNRQFGRTFNLGKLPPGEIIFSIATPQRHTFQTGHGPRNPDRIPHAVLRTFKAGFVEVWFEDLYGPRPDSDRDFNDAVFRLSGGVSDNNTVGDLLKVISEQKGEPRQLAIEALKKLNPRAAANAGFR